MKFKNLNVKWNKITALLLAGTMVFGFAGCSKDKSDEDIETAYVQTVEKRIDEYLELTREYNKAKEIYESYPTKENLAVLKDKTTELSESVFNKIREKLGVDFFCFIYEEENGDIKYTMHDPKDENIVYTHVVTAEGENYGEINSEIITGGLVLVYKISNKKVNEWTKSDIEKFLETAQAIEDNAKEVFLTDFEIKDGNIYEVKPEIKKNVKE